MGLAAFYAARARRLLPAAGTVLVITADSSRGTAAAVAGTVGARRRTGQRALRRQLPVRDHRRRLPGHADPRRSSTTGPSGSRSSSICCTGITARHGMVRAAPAAAAASTGRDGAGGGRRLVRALRVLDGPGSAVGVLLAAHPGVGTGGRRRDRAVGALVAAVSARDLPRVAGVGGVGLIGWCGLTDEYATPYPGTAARSPCRCRPGDRRGVRGADPGRGALVIRAMDARGGAAVLLLVSVALAGPAVRPTLGRHPLGWAGRAGGGDGLVRVGRADPALHRAPTALCAAVAPVCRWAASHWAVPSPPRPSARRYCCRCSCRRRSGAGPRPLPRWCIRPPAPAPERAARSPMPSPPCNRPSRFRWARPPCRPRCHRRWPMPPPTSRKFSSTAASGPGGRSAYRRARPVTRRPPRPSRWWATRTPRCGSRLWNPLPSRSIGDWSPWPRSPAHCRTCRSSAPTWAAGTPSAHSGVPR